MRRPPQRSRSVPLSSCRHWPFRSVPLLARFGYSGIYAGIHYPGDVLAGAIAGAGIALAGAQLAPARQPTRVRPPDR